MNKSNICKAANHLTAAGLPRSDAFRAAWLMAKRGGVAKVAGVTHENRQRLIARLAAYTPDQVTVSLQRDQANIFDPAAIAVVATVKGRSAVVGFIPALTAARLCRLMDGGITIKAVLEGIVGGRRGLSYGLRLRLAI